MDELYLITPEYLVPYLSYVKENQRLFRTGIENAAALRLEDSYKGLSRYVITPVLDRYGVPEREKPYLMAFYLHGLMAVISEWLKNDCAKPAEYIAGVIQRCVKRRAEEQQKPLPAYNENPSIRKNRGIFSFSVIQQGIRCVSTYGKIRDCSASFSGSDNLLSWR